MPQMPYPYSGIVYDDDGLTVIEGATVTAYDKNTGTKTPPDITDANGGYVVDLANMTSDYTLADNITVEAVYGNKIKQYRTIVLESGEEEHNFTLEYSDAIGVIIDLLNDNWDKSTTDNIKPVIDRIFNRKIQDLENNDYLLLYELGETIDPFNIGGTTFQEITGISIDARTSNKIDSISGVRGHVIKMREEVKRILKANLQDPALPFQLLIPRRVRDLSDKSVGLGRVVMDWDLKYWGSG